MHPDTVAEFLVAQLNSLIEDPLVRHELAVFLQLELAVTGHLAKHPRPGLGPNSTLSFLGVLNGLLGEKRVAAEFEGPKLVRFRVVVPKGETKWEIY